MRVTGIPSAILQYLQSLCIQAGDVAALGRTRRIFCLCVWVRISFIVLLSPYPLFFSSRKGGCVRISDPVQKKDVLVMSFCKSSTEMLCPSPIPPASTLEIFVEQIDPAWYHKNYWKSPIDFIRVVSGSLQGQVLAVLLSSSVHLIVGICFQLQKRQLTVRTLSIL